MDYDGKGRATSGIVPGPGQSHERGSTMPKGTRGVTLCSVPNCGRRLDGDGLCNMHRRRVEKYGEPGPASQLRELPPPTCSVESCNRRAAVKGMCPRHRDRYLKGLPLDTPIKARHAPGQLCSVEPCDRLATCQGMCDFHYRRQSKGLPLVGEVQRGKPPKTRVDDGGRECTRCHLYKAWSEFGPGSGARKRKAMCHPCENESSAAAKAERDFGPCSVPGCPRQATHGKGHCGTHASRRTRGIQLDLPIRTPAPPGSGHVNKDGYRFIKVNGRNKAEHRIKMEELLGRKLVSPENVHHINGDKGDNTTDGPLVNFRSGNLELWSKSQPSGQSVADKVAWAKAMLALYEPEALA